MTGSSNPRNSEKLSYFTVDYGNSSSLVEKCGTAPSMEAYETTVAAYVANFTLYCDSPHAVRYLKISSANKNEFDLCELNVHAERVGKFSSLMKIDRTGIS